MKIILAMVISVDGKSTKWDFKDQSWASLEDKNHLSKLISEYNLILMGGKTYEHAKKYIKPQLGKLRVVLTRDPEKFSEDEIKNQLEFTNLQIRDLILELEKRGFEKMLLLSGEGLNKEFFEHEIIDELILTVEPKIFGKGNLMIGEANLDINLRLLSFEKLNEKGTLLLHYEVIR